MSVNLIKKIKIFQTQNNSTVKLRYYTNIKLFVVFADSVSCLNNTNWISVSFLTHQDCHIKAAKSVSIMTHQVYHSVEKLSKVNNF